MGRRKIAIQPLTDERNRAVTFLKRKAGLFKKAHELAVLCQVDIAVIIFGQNNRLYEFSSVDDVGSIVERYGSTQPHEAKRPKDFDKSRVSSLKGDRHDSVDLDDDDDDSEGASTPVPTKQSSHSRHSSLSTNVPHSKPVARVSGAIHKKHASLGSMGRSSSPVPRPATTNSVSNDATDITYRDNSEGFLFPYRQQQQQQQAPPQQQVHQAQQQQSNAQAMAPARNSPQTQAQARMIENAQYEYVDGYGAQRGAQIYANRYAPGQQMAVPAQGPVPQYAYNGVPGQYPQGYAIPPDQQQQYARMQAIELAYQDSRLRQGQSIGQEYARGPPPGQQYQMGGASQQHMMPKYAMMPGAPSPSSVPGSSQGSGQGSHVMRPKLKVQIPLGDSGESQISSTEHSKEANASPDGSTPNDAVTSGKDQDASKDNEKGPGNGGEGSSELTPKENRGGAGTSAPESSSSNQSATQNPNGPSSGSGSGSGSGAWASLTLPPPSPSSYFNSSGGVGPGNPFGRPPLVSNNSNNGEQTPLSAALPSKYVHDLLPSPSNFYGTEWSMHFGPASGYPQSATGGNPIVQQFHQLQQQSPVTTTPPSQSGQPPTSNTAAASGAGSSSAPPASSSAHPPTGIRASHLVSSNDMLPSPLQFSGTTPAVAQSSQSLAEGSSRKRNDGKAAGNGNGKRQRTKKK